MSDKIKFPPLPNPIFPHPYDAALQMKVIRARDLEVVRVVLEAAAQVVKRKLRLMAMTTPQDILALEFTHD